MHPDVAALLAVQDDDIAIHELETRLAELTPRLESMAQERDKAIAALQQAQKSAESEERRRQDVAARVAQHRALQEKNQNALNSVTSMREATAATAQLEQAKRMIDEDERELAAIGARLMEANRLVTDRERIAGDLEIAQTQAHESLSADKQQLESQIGSARSARADKAKRVPRTLLARYDRIRSRKRVHAVFPLRGHSCGHCDTMIPLQRRSIMAGTGATEICEGCGVMLYAAD
ncbi:MAG: zinc ribbon domain-containing protein [Gemmatimonadaceae bacterium]